MSSQMQDPYNAKDKQNAAVNIHELFNILKTFF